MEVVYQAPLGPESLLFLIGLLLVGEIAFRFGRAASARTDQELRNQVATLEAAVLGMLGLLLGFTFSMAASRYETRRQLVLEEANAIGTAYLRTGALDEGAGREVRGLLRQYIDARLEFADAGEDLARVRAASERAEQLQGGIWSRAMDAARSEPRAVTLGLLLQALNDVIDLHSKRATAFESHVPESILGLLILVSSAALSMVGYTLGLTRRRQLAATFLVSLLVCAIVAVIVDLDRPRSGLIHVSQQSMKTLRDSLARSAR